MLTPEATRLLVLLSELTGIADPDDLRKLREVTGIIQQIVMNAKKPIDNPQKTVVVEVDGKPVDVKVGK